MNTSLPFKIQFPALPLGVSITTTLHLNIVLLQVEAKDVNDLFGELEAYLTAATMTQSGQAQLSGEPCMKKCYETHSISPPFHALPFPETACIKEKNSPCSKCYMKCFPEKFQCGFGCAFEHFTSQDFEAYRGPMRPCHAETTGECYKCVDECAKTATNETARLRYGCYAGATGTSAVREAIILKKQEF